jgi:hypothetical protein
VGDGLEKRGNFSPWHTGSATWSNWPTGVATRFDKRRALMEAWGAFLTEGEFRQGRAPKFWVTLSREAAYGSARWSMPIGQTGDRRIGTSSIAAIWLRQVAAAARARAD